MLNLKIFSHLYAEFQIMKQKQKIEAQYLKLIGVTLMMTAACVSDAGNKNGFAFADESVREVILEHFQMYSNGHWAEVIEWDNAIKQVSESGLDGEAFQNQIDYKVVKASGSLPKLNLAGKSTHDNYQLRHALACYKSECVPDKKANDKDLNKYSLITRAGPLA